MHHLIYYINNLIQYVDPRVLELEKDIEFMQIVLWGLAVVITILLFIIYLQRRSLAKYRGTGNRGIKKFFQNISPKKKETGMKGPVSQPVQAAQRDLPDPGLIYKYSLAKEHVLEKSITVGQIEGNIKTFSTEIIDDHLTIYIRIIENSRDRDIYNLPDTVTEEYQLDLRRDGKVLIYYEGLDGFREMGSRERIYIKPEPDEGGDPTFPQIEARHPVRLRLGDRLNQDGKFINGYFEFHLFTQNYTVKTKAGIPKVEKNFLIRLYKIYPGYDTGAPTDEGLYPMVDPYTTG